MSTLVSFLVFRFGLIGFFRTLGLVAGIVLIFVWWSKVKSTVALFYDKAKIRATLMFFVPGLILVCLGVYFRFIWSPSFEPYSYSSDYDSLPEEEYIPTLATVYIANYSDKMGKIQVGDFVDSLKSKESKELNIRSKNDRDTLRAWLGDSLVVDTILERGTWVANFSDDISVVAEEVVYSSYASSSTEDLDYILLSKPGIEKFSGSANEDVYGFESEAPATMSVSSSTSRIHKWDVDLLTDEEFMRQIIEALGKEKTAGGDEE